MVQGGFVLERQDKISTSADPGGPRDLAGEGKLEKQKHSKIFGNPTCSSILGGMPDEAAHRRCGIERVEC